MNAIIIIVTILILQIIFRPSLDFTRSGYTMLWYRDLKKGGRTYTKFKI